jgi:hypothetical protein
LNNIISRNDELNKLRANIKGLGEKLNTNMTVLPSRADHNPSSSKGFLSKMSMENHQVKDFTFQPLKDTTNLNGKQIILTS